MTDNFNLTPGAPAQAPPPMQQFPPAAEPRRRYGQGRRAFYGIMWAAWTAALAIGGFAALSGGQVLGGLLALVLAAFAGHYDYRIWTWRARRLLFLIIW